MPLIYLLRGDLDKNDVYNKSGKGGKYTAILRQNKMATENMKPKQAKRFSSEWHCTI